MNHLGDTNKMVDTPRTEAEVNRSKCWSDDLVTIDANFAAQLERELNRACEMYRKLDIHTLNLVDRIRRLEEAGDAVAAIIGPPGSAHWADENQVDAAWTNWTKAKEDKL